MLQRTYHIVHFEFDKETFHLKRNEITTVHKATQFIYFSELLYGLKKHTHNTLNKGRLYNYADVLIFNQVFLFVYTDKGM